MQITTRARRAAIGAAVAVSLGGGALGVAHAVVSDGSRAIFVPIVPCRLQGLGATKLYHTVPLPAGSIITGMTVRTNNGGPSSYVVLLLRQPKGVVTTSDVRTASVSTTTGVHEAALPLTTPHTMQAGDAYFVQFQQNTGAPYLCAVDIQYIAAG